MITVRKLHRDYKVPIYQTDHDIVEQFVHEPRLFLDNDLELAMRLKHLYEKRTK